MDILHSYAQSYPHQEACIAGTKDHLIKLKDVINEAINNGQSMAELMTNDRESIYYSKYGKLFFETTARKNLARILEIYEKHNS